MLLKNCINMSVLKVRRLMESSCSKRNFVVLRGILKISESGKVGCGMKAYCRDAGGVEAFLACGGKVHENRIHQADFYGRLKK